MSAAKAFLGGFLDGFTMAGIWKPRLPIPGAAPRLFRAEEAEWQKRLEVFQADLATKANEPEEAHTVEEIGPEQLKGLLEGRKRFKEFVDEGLAAQDAEVRRKYSEAELLITERAAALINRMSEVDLMPYDALTRELLRLFVAAMERGKELGLDEEQMNKLRLAIIDLRAAILERHRNAERALRRELRPKAQIAKPEKIRPPQPDQPDHPKPPSH